MKEVEKRLELVTGRKEIGQEINQGEREQLMALADRLAEPEIALTERLEIVFQMRGLLSGKGMLMEGYPQNENRRRPSDPLPSPTFLGLS